MTKKTMRFIGNIEAKTDSKGRVFVPAVFRRTLQSAGTDRLMMRKDIFQDCLVLYPETTWNKRLDEMRERLDVWNRNDQNIFRKFVAYVEELSLDSNGRILIPKRYMVAAGIQQEVCFVGMDDTIEIWAKEKFEESLMDAETFSIEIEKTMSRQKKENNSND